MNRMLIANPIASMAQGGAVADQFRESGRNRALDALYADRGADIVNGDAGAINALAALDPQAAMRVNQQNFQNEQTVAAGNRAERGLGMQEQNLQMRQAEFKRQVEKDAASITKQEAATKAAKIEEGVKAAAAAQTPEQWDAIAERMGQPDLVGQFEFKDALLNSYMTAAEIYKQAQPQKPQTQVAKLKADFEAGRIDQATYEAAIQKATAQDGLRVSTGPEGGITVEQGAAVTSERPPKLTVDAAKNTGFLIRTQKANEILNELEGQGSRFGQQMLENVPLGLGNFARDPEFQKFDQARRDFVNAVLRRESGAVISDQEFDNADKQYFPVPGDSAEVIAQKRANREATIQGLSVGAGDGAAFVDRQNATASAANPYIGMSEEDFGQVKIHELTDEQVKQLLEARKR